MQRDHCQLQCFKSLLLPVVSSPFKTKEVVQKMVQEKICLVLFVPIVSEILYGCSICIAVCLKVSQGWLVSSQNGSVEV